MGLGRSLVYVFPFGMISLGLGIAWTLELVQSGSHTQCL